jgi:multicomponent Na+:H+ antiporter subunit B
MKPSQRKVFFLIAAGGLACFLFWGLVQLPAFGHYRGPYGYRIDKVTVRATHATGLVSAVNFFFRGFDTVGEEFILFVAATGVAVILRGLREKDESEGPAAGSTAVPHTTSAVRMYALVLTGPVLVFGWYLTSHAQTSPAGGFQGGAVLASAVGLIYLAGQYLKLKRTDPVVITDSVEAAGAAGFAVIGLFGLIAGGTYLADVLPLGKHLGAVNAAGTIPLISLCVGIEVSAAFLLILSELLGQTLVQKGALTE